MVMLTQTISFFGRAPLMTNQGFCFDDFNVPNAQDITWISRKHFEIERIEKNVAIIRVIGLNGVVLQKQSRKVVLKSGQSAVLSHFDRIAIGNQRYFKFCYRYPAINYDHYDIPHALMDKYLIGKVLAIGGQGSVRTCFDLTRVVDSNDIHPLIYAMKVCPILRRNDDNTQSYEKRIEHLEYEVLNMQILNQHINIVKFVETFVGTNYRYIVMEFCHTDLLKFMKSLNPVRIPENTAKSIFYQVCRGLRFIHDHKIAHRDIKIENIFLSKFTIPGRETIHVPKIGDFGYSKNIDDHLTTQLGTDVYLPPEIHEGKEYNEKADIWTLGCMFFGMLSGSYPFYLSYSKTRTLREQIMNVEINWTSNCWNSVRLLKTFKFS